MTRHGDILSKVDPDNVLYQQKPALGRKVKLRPRLASPFTALAARFFAGPEKVKILAFTALTAGEGVTTTIRALAQFLEEAQLKVKVIQAEDLNLGEHNQAQLSSSRILGLREEHLEHDPNYVLDELRRNYDAVLLDCGSLASSPEIVRMSAFADGVVLVVEAGKWRDEQVKRGADTLRSAGLHLLGVVLNKRRYPIPQWLYRLLA